MPGRSSATRAAHRELRSLLRLFRASHSCAICARTPWRMAQYDVVQTSIASCARSYVCFGPIIPVPFARERLGAWRNITLYKQASRAALAPTLVSGQSFLCHLRANALAHGAISRCTNKHRKLRSLLRLFRANHSCAICARTPWRMAQYHVVQTRRSRVPVTGVTGLKQT